MSKQVQLSDLVESIKTGLISVIRAESKTKISTDITDINQIEPEKFIESIDLLNKTIFGNSIDFFYEFIGEHTVSIKCKMQNIYMADCFYAECSLENGITTEEVDAKFKETIFDKMDKKLAQCKQ